jgi:hypothetical protein
VAERSTVVAYNRSGDGAEREAIAEVIGTSNRGVVIPAIVNVNRGWPVNIGPIIITIRNGVIPV